MALVLEDCKSNKWISKEIAAGEDQTYQMVQTAVGLFYRDDKLKFHKLQHHKEVIVFDLESKARQHFYFPWEVIKVFPYFSTLEKAEGMELWLKH